MTKEELSTLLHGVCKTVNEGITSQKNENVYPRIVYWDYVWEDVLASGETYEDLNTYQISVFALVPPQENESLLNLRKQLRTAGEHPRIYHEYNDSDGVWHSYMSLQVDCGVAEV